MMPIFFALMLLGNPLTQENVPSPMVVVGRSQPSEKDFAYFAHKPNESLVKPSHISIREGGASPVCKAFVEYVTAQSFRPDASDGPRCYRSYLREYAGITRPDVVFLSNSEKRALLNYVTNAKVSNGRPRANMREIEEFQMWYVDTGIDIDNDGTDDPIYFVAHGKCDEASGSSSPAFSIRPYIWNSITNERNERV